MLPVDDYAVASDDQSLFQSGDDLYLCGDLLTYCHNGGFFVRGRNPVPLSPR